jgi:hypothetical protein
MTDGTPGSGLGSHHGQRQQEIIAIDTSPGVVRAVGLVDLALAMGAVRRTAGVAVAAGPAPHTPAQLTVLRLLVAGRARADALVTIGLGHPVRQTRLRDPEVRRDVLDPHARLTVAGDPDDVLPELPRIGPRP